MNRTWQDDILYGYNMHTLITARAELAKTLFDRLLAKGLPDHHGCNWTQMEKEILVEMASAVKNKSKKIKKEICKLHDTSCRTRML